MEIRVLKYFLMVAREESITRAAEVLHITQPTLSRQLSQLEEDVGVRLLERGTRRVTLTAEGMLLRRRAEEIVSLADKTERELSEAEERIEGIINIGGGELLVTASFARLIKSFRRLHPRVTFDYYTGITDQINERMDQGLTDIGILVEPFDMEKYDFVRIHPEARWGVMMRGDDPLAGKEYIRAEDLTGRNIILPGRRKLNAELETWLGNVYEKIHVPMLATLAANTAVMVEEGIGVSFTSEGAVPLGDDRRIRFVPLYPEISIRTALAWKRHQPFSHATTSFIRYLKEQLKEK